MTRISTARKPTTRPLRSMLKLRNRTVARKLSMPTVATTTTKAAEPSVITFKAAPRSPTAKTSPYRPLGFINAQSKRLLFVKPRPTASNYRRICRSLNLTTLRYGCEIRKNPFETLTAIASH